MNHEPEKTARGAALMDKQPITGEADELTKRASQAMTLYALGFLPGVVESVRHQRPPELSEVEGYTANSAKGWMDEFPAYGDLIEQAPELDEDLSGLISGFREFLQTPGEVPFVMNEIPLRSTQKAGLVAAEEILNTPRNYINHRMVAERAEEQYGLDMTNTAASGGITSLTSFIGVDRQEIDRGQSSIDVEEIRQYEEEMERYLFCVDVPPGYLVNNHGSRDDRNEGENQISEKGANSRHESQEKNPLNRADIERAAGEEIEFEGEKYVISRFNSGVGGSKYSPLTDTDGAYWTKKEMTEVLREGERYLFRRVCDEMLSVPGTESAVPVSESPVESLSDVEDLLERQ